MTKNLRTIWILLLFFSQIAFPQEIVTWDILSNMKNIQAAFETSAGVWAATDGGVFYYNFNDRTYKKFTKADGLSGLPVTAIAKDTSNNIWLGCENGQIDIINAVTNTVIRNIINIRDSRFTDKRINGLTISGDSVFVATGYGITLMNAKNFSFIDTYFTLSDATLIKSVDNIFWNGRIFAALGEGIAVQNIGVTILNEPSAWKFYSKVENNQMASAKKLCMYNGSVLAATSFGLAVFRDSLWAQYITALAGRNIHDVTVSADSLIILTADYSVYSFKSNVLTLIKTLSAEKPLTLIGQQHGLLLTSANGIINAQNNGMVLSIVPDGLPDKKIYNLYADHLGQLWVATGKNNGGSGLFRYSENSWKVFSSADTRITTNDFVNAFTYTNGDVYAGTWGAGLMRLQGTDNITMFNASNTPLLGIPAAPSFIVIGGIVSDSKKNLWILNYWPGDKNLFAVLTPDSSWKMIQHPSFITDEGYTSVSIDDNDTKWYVHYSGKPLYFYNENGTFGNTTDDHAGSVTNSGNLAGKSINSVVVDKRNELWVGTEAGVYVLSDTRSILTSSPGAFNALYPLRGFKVNAIVVDGINRKWIATSKGLLLVSPDGNTILEHYKATDSPLLSDEVEKLAIDLKNGIVYAASATGIAAIHTAAVEPKTDYSEVKIFPNPVLLHKETQVTFEGLVKETEIKIMNAAGRLVRHIVTPGGGKGYWNGLDENGNTVPSGIYFIVLFDKEGTITSVEKLAVIRN
ncbi:MAG: T9SS type A sorting domain-containing protein [Ignavibacteriales bacterium]|nr:T9SS type A sorting domain-containing protein [Ignavibacteriales bacterium]